MTGRFLRRSSWRIWIVTALAVIAVIAPRAGTAAPLGPGPMFLAQQVPGGNVATLNPIVANTDADATPWAATGTPRVAEPPVAGDPSANSLSADLLSAILPDTSSRIEPVDTSTRTYEAAIFESNRWYAAARAQADLAASVPGPALDSEEPAPGPASDLSFARVPEPASILLLGAALTALASQIRLRRR